MLFEINTSSNETIPQPFLNKSNWCYINSILQTLCALPNFSSFLNQIHFQYSESVFERKYPVLSALSLFRQDLISLNPLTFRRKTIGPIYEPTQIYHLLTDLSNKNKQLKEIYQHAQQDAEEILTFLLNAMHDEWTELVKEQCAKKNPQSTTKSQIGDINMETTTSDFDRRLYICDNNYMNKNNGNLVTDSNTDEDEWNTIVGSGRKNKSTVVRQITIESSPIQQMFGGQLSSNLSHTCCKNTSNSIQPFLVLPLDIRFDSKPQTLAKIIQDTFVTEYINSYICPQTKQTVQARKFLSIHKLPEYALILQLKCFNNMTLNNNNNISQSPTTDSIVRNQQKQKTNFDFSPINKGSQSHSKYTIMTNEKSYNNKSNQYMHQNSIRTNESPASSYKKSFLFGIEIPLIFNPNQLFKGLIDKTSSNMARSSSGTETYKLRSLICHQGLTLSKGHYLTYVRYNYCVFAPKKLEEIKQLLHPSNDANGYVDKHCFDLERFKKFRNKEVEVWYKISDDCIEIIPDIEVELQNQFSPGSNNNPKDSFINKSQNSMERRNNNLVPYLIIYTKEKMQN